MENVTLTANLQRGPMNPTMELLKSHRSIRKFTNQQVSRELLKR